MRAAPLPPSLTLNADDLSPENWLDQHGDALYAFAMMRVATPAAAEDLVQETLLAAISAVERYDGRASMRTWLVGILKNKLIDHLRRSARETGFEPEAIDAADYDGRFDATGHWLEAPVDWGDPARLAESADLGVTMSECIARLPDKLRTPFVMREVDDLDTAEIMSVLGISSKNNLWVILSRARERVRQCLQTNWYGEQR